jgi:hypothetical protein
VTGYLVEATGSFNSDFVLAGALRAVFQNNLQNIFQHTGWTSSKIRNQFQGKWAMMTILLNANGANGFKKWFIAHPPSSNDDD